MAAKWRGIAMLAVAALTGALNVAAAHADSTSYGVSFPENPADYDAGTGVQTAQIRITADSPLIGAGVPIDFTFDEASGITWFAGLSPEGEPGASCGKQSASGTQISWTCVPGAAGWDAGSLLVRIDTTTTKTNCTLLPSGEMWACGEDTVRFGGPDAPAAGSTASSDGQTWAGGFGVGIVPGPAPCATTPPPCAASATGTATRSTPSAARSAAAPRSATPNGRVLAASSSVAVPSPSGSASSLLPSSTAQSTAAPTPAPAAVTAASSAPVRLDAAPAASSSGSGSNGIEVALPIVIVVLVVAFLGWRLGTRRRRDGDSDESGSGSTSGSDESGE